MEDRVKKPLEPSQLTQLDDSLTTMEQVFKAIGTPLQSQERLEALKPRKGCENFVALMITIAQELGINLNNYSLAQMEIDQKIREQLPTLIHRLQSLSQLASDTLLAASSEYWNGFLSYYRVLSAIAQSNADIAMRLKPITEFMAHNTRKNSKDID